MTRKPVFSRVGIVVKPAAGRAAGRALQETLDLLEKHGVNVLLDEEAARVADRAGGIHRRELTAEVEAVIIIGGDGTLLSVARHVGPSGPRLVGINLGSLGFLTEIRRDEIQGALERVLAGEAREEKRMMLKATVTRNGERPVVYNALNDIVLAKSALARTVHLQVEVDGERVSAYRSDGLIISTPTGSTAYSLSAGGPLMHPGIDAMLITPICPHALANRPLIIPARSRIAVSSLSRGSEVHVTADGQVGGPLDTRDRIEVRRSRTPLRLLHAFPRGFYATLRSKLKWN